MLCVPQYENLSIERIIQTARKDSQISLYLPEDRDMHKVPRQWLINVVYTVIGEPFRAWVTNEIAHRNEELAKKQKLLIEMDPEVARAFHSSVNISSKCIHWLILRIEHDSIFLFHTASNGSSAHLLKAGSKRRRTQAEMKQQMEVEELANVLEHEREDQIKQLEEQLSQAQENAASNKNAADILTDLLEKGEVKLEEDGSVSVMHGANVIGNASEF